MTNVRLAIVGYRDWHDYDKLCEYITKWKKDNNIDIIDIIISGACTGVDTLAEKYAHNYNIKTNIFPPNWTKYGRDAGKIRNKLIVDDSTHILALVHPKSRGTWHTINYAKSKNINTTIIYL